MAEVKRREFLKTAGAGAIAMASLPAWVSALARAASADGNKRGFYFVVVSKAGTSVHRLAISGFGVVDSDDVEGGGSFVHYDASKPAGQNIVASGTWRTNRLVSFELTPDPDGKGGSLASGILDMRAKLHRETPSRLVIDANLEVVCNLGFAGLSTGKEEGVAVAIPGTDFDEGHTPGPFEPWFFTIANPPPAMLPFGVTVFTGRVAED